MHVRMLKVDVALPKNKWKELLNVIANLGFFHPEEYKGENGAVLNEDEEELKGKASRVLTFIREIEEFFGKIDGLPGNGNLDFDGVKRARDGLMALVRDISMFEEELRKLMDYYEIAEEMGNLKGEGFDVFAVVLGREELGSKEILKKWALENKIEVFERIRKDKVLILLRVKSEDANKVKEFLEENAFPIAKPPKGYKSLEEVKRAIDLEIPEAIKNLKETARVSFESVKEFLERQKFLAEEIIFYLNSKEKFLSFSRFLVSIKGWIPAGLKGEFERAIKSLDEKAFVRFSEPKNYEYENVPVILKNSPPASYYQAFLEIYTPPVYKTVDPSTFIALFFPIYYGFMLGDAGYGIVGMFLFWLLSNAFKAGSLGYNLSMVYFINSIFATIFGLIFGEIFGDFGIKLGIITPMFHRTHEVIDLVLIAVGLDFSSYFWVC